MKINRDKLQAFLKKVHCDGVIEECVLDFQENQVTCLSKDVSSIALVNVSLSKNAFKTYKAIGQIGISSLRELILFTTRFNEEILINLENNMLIFSDEERDLEVILPDISFLKQEINIDKINSTQFPVETTIESKIFLNSVANASALKSSTFRLSVENKILTIETGDDNKFKEKQKTDIEQNIKGEFNEFFKNMIGQVPESFKISLGTNLPMRISFTKDEVTATYILAPIVEE